MPLPPVGAEPTAWLTLSQISPVSDRHKRSLLATFGTPANVLAASVASISAVVGEKAAAAFATPIAAEKIAAAEKWLSAEHNHLITLADDDYPKLLLEISDPPLILFGKGRRELLGGTALAVVGSRNATPGGLQNAEAFSETLSNAGLTIVSGMALGIDAAAHRGGLRGHGASIAVVGTGLDLVYPARNKTLAHSLAEGGLILSEFDLGTPALAQNFPRRNRIISGLSRGVLVVEAALASGSLITARQAVEQGRDVFAIPGSIHSPFSKGCHQLIKQGAKLVDAAEDVLSELGVLPLAAASQSTTDQHQATSDAARDDEANALITAMGFDAVTVDALATRTGQSAQEISTALMTLELDGLVACLPGGAYQRLR